MRNALIFASALAAALPGYARASGYEFDGVGARAVARGGAVTAAATDWTAIYWNPAGLAAAGERHLEWRRARGGCTPRTGILSTC